MRSTGKAVWRPTAPSIARCFALSGRRHLLLTGRRKAGKSTLFRALLPLLTSLREQDAVRTWAEPGRGVWAGRGGAAVQLGRYDASAGGTENKMRPAEKGPEAFAALLDDCRRSGADWAAVDEIGYLEGDSATFRDALAALLAQKRVLAVVRGQSLPWLDALRRREDVCLIDLDAPPEAGCIIMASGRGERFGGNKLLAELEGRPLLQWVLDAAADAFASCLVVTRHESVAALCERNGVPGLRHDLPRRSDAIRLGLSRLSPAGGCAFFAGDQPLVRPGTAETLALCARLDPSALWRLSWHGTAGAPVLFPVWAYDELLCLGPDEGGRTVAARHAGQMRLLPAEREEELFDVDTPEDLARLKRLPGRGASCGEI